MAVLEKNTMMHTATFIIQNRKLVDKISGVGIRVMHLNKDVIGANNFFNTLFKPTFPYIIHDDNSVFKAEMKALYEKNNWAISNGSMA